MGLNKGAKLSKAHKKKISLSLKGRKRSKAHCLNISKAAKERLKDPTANANYRGDKVGYVGIHIWLRKHFKNPLKCELCGIEGTNKTGKWNIVWALKKSFKYERKRENFFGLCNKCHRSYDKTATWNANISKSKSKLI